MPTAAPPAGPSSRLRGPLGRRVGGTALLAVLVASAAYGGNLFGIRDRLLPPPHPAAPVAHGAASTGGRAVLASQPYWQPVTTIEGAATATTRPVTISGGALQWRATWRCQQGRLSVRTPGGSGATSSRPLLDTACPGQGVAYAVSTGSVSLVVAADGPWRLEIEQQIDVPLEQPPLAAMSAPGAAAVSTGSFYGIDQQGNGRVTVDRLADGSYALRLDSFYVTPNSDLEVRFSAPPAPHSDDDVANAPYASVAPLVATTGSMNLLVPRTVDPSRYRSVVIWCLKIRTAYAAATLSPAP